jgi:DNA segregation ATPase FtsK/SpoIIIE, S-DNA-T family
MNDFIRKFFANYIVQILVFSSLGAVFTAALVTHSNSDPSFNLISHKYPDNALSFFGAHLSDILYQLFGLGAFIFPLYFFSWACAVFKNRSLSFFSFKLIGMVIAAVSLSLAFAEISFKTLPAGGGGVIGIIVTPMISQFGILANIGFGILAIFIIVLTAGISLGDYSKLLRNIKSLFAFKLPSLKLPFNNAHFQTAVAIKKAPMLDFNNNARPLNAPDPQPTHSPKVTEMQPKKPLVAPVYFENTISNSNSGSLPPIDLLKNPNNQNIKVESVAELKSNAENLISVLDDFGVKGQIVDVSQGPVVTLYELEPAPGTKSSRVVGLSDDIARSLSALSTRIAIVPGRNALGIELPNKQRAFFCLRELIETPEYQDPSNLLPLILGKDLAGKPFIADLAKMPHLLVAGTTGSGKSVAINTMIMSLLYRYTPAECRLIMIDPKMLELSVYDNIPHLLTPVVTESSKAVVALKWAVKEMENRYRLMSNVGVRNIAGYNAKIVEYIKEGKTLERTVQTGFDSETGKPIFESTPIPMEKLPFIVVIVDEMADLMIVAGKDIESSIQRLAQMARAAGIHIIMATQRPSVDVITGVIKANFPSRISFKVTSKIDSRTILGEQGSEQLLGMGDMLYMGNASRIIRVHGPFVDDTEVEKVTNYLRSTGTPSYVSAVTESNDEDVSNSLEDFGDGDDDETIYRKAKQIVQLERKISISYIQRCLRIGYNRAANIVDRMERDGLISQPSHTGKREILMPEE